jgi:acyl-CoA synthetase (AMP-forming)/AMP-acid ligase II
MDSLQEMTMRALARGSGSPAIEWRERWFDWGQLKQVADRVRVLLKESGVAARAPIALLPRNHPAAIAAMFGVIIESHTIQMIHVYQSASGIARDVARLKPAAVIGMNGDFTEQVCAVLKEHGICGIALEDVGAAFVPGYSESTGGSIAGGDGAQFELLTSGTTGPPKQFPLNYAMLAEHMVGKNLFNTGSAADPANMPPIFQYLSFSTITGLYLVLPTLLHGIRITLVDRFTLPEWHAYVLRHRPHFAGLPPPAVQMIMQAEIPKEDLASIRCVNTGAAPLDPHLHRAFEERYGIPILLAYGATEFGGPVTQMTYELYQQWGQRKLGSVGRPFAGAQLRAVDPGTGNVLPSGTEGVLEVVAPRMGPQWIRTSDLGLVDEDGFVFIRGRADGAIIRGGFKLIPDDIERALMLHRAVAAAGVAGIADQRLGQVPAAAIQLDARKPKPTIAELEAHLREHVPGTHVPVKWCFVDTLPYTIMMKVDRAALRRLLELEPTDRLN